MLYYYNTLSWKSQVQQVIKKVNKVLYCLKTIRPCTSQALRKRLVESFVVPHLDYCNVVYSDITDELGVQLQRLANSIIRYIYGLLSVCEWGNPLFSYHFSNPIKRTSQNTNLVRTLTYPPLWRQTGAFTHSKSMSISGTWFPPAYVNYHHTYVLRKQ